MIDRDQLLQHAKAQQATDVHICANAPVLFRIGGELIPITKEKLTTEQSKEITHWYQSCIRCPDAQT